MAKIFVSFFNAINDKDNPYVVPGFYEAFLNGLKQAGNEILAYGVTVWKLPYENCPVDIKKQIKEFDPDLIILFNNFFYDISDDFDCPIIIYEVDSFLYYQNKEVLRQKPDRFLYFVPQTMSVEVLRDNLGVDKNKILYLPFFSEIYPQKTEFQNNIIFIGSKFSVNGSPCVVKDFMKQNPNDKQRLLMKEIVNTIEMNPFISKEDLVKHLGEIDPLVEQFLDMGIDSIITHVCDERRIRSLLEIDDLGLCIYGTPNWGTDMPFLQKLSLCYNNKLVYSLQDQQNIYNSSKIGFNVNHVQAMSGFSWRVADIMASNACLVSEYKPDFGVLFPKIKLPLFNSQFEARELCVKLLKDESLRKDIVSACNEVIDEKYRFKHVLAKIEEFTGICLHQQAQGSLSIYSMGEVKENKFGLLTKLKLCKYLSLGILAQLPLIGMIIPKKKYKKILQKLTALWNNEENV